MKNEYEVGVSKNNKPTIIIRRKPSQIPGHLDMALLRLALTAQMDGPNNIVTYEFLIPDRLPEAERYLNNSMWVKK